MAYFGHYPKSERVTISNPSILSKFYKGDYDDAEDYPNGILKKKFSNGESLLSVRLYGTIPPTLVINSDILRYLQELFISGRDIRNIPQGIDKLIELRVLWISYCNNLEIIPDNIGKLTNLQQLFLKANCIYRMPETTTNLINLIDLDLSNNRIQEKDEVESIIPILKENTNLLRLDLSHNFIDSISCGELVELFKTNTCLIHLELYRNYGFSHYGFKQDVEKLHVEKTKF